MRFIQEIKLKTEEQLLHFQELTEKFLKIKLPISYLKASKVFLYIDNNGKAIAGYLINDSQDLRLITQIPPGVKQEEFKHLPFNPKDLFEINALWISPRLSKGTYNLYIWYRMTWNALKMKKKALLISANTQNKTILRYHQLMRPGLIYEGAPYIENATDQSFLNVRYSYVKKHNIAMAWFRGVSMIIKKIKVR